MFEQLNIENIEFWFCFYYDMFAPFVSLFVSMAFNTVVIKKIYNIIKIDKQIKIVYIKIKESIPTE